MITEASNDTLYKVANELGIPKSNIILTEFADKYEIFEGKDFVWHLDDDWIELEMINKNTSTIGISVFGTTNWRKKCNKLIGL